MFIFAIGKFDAENDVDTVKDKVFKSKKNKWEHYRKF